MTGELVHSLWVTVSVLGALGSLAFAAGAGRRARKVRGRGVELLSVEPSRHVPTRTRAVATDWVRCWGPPLAVVATGWVLLGGMTGWVVGVVCAYGLRRWLRTRKRDDSRRDERAIRQLPLAADLLAACVAAGAGPREAAEAVGESLGGPVGDRLARTAAEVRLGGEPADAWGRFGEMPGAAGLARCLERAGASGAPAAEQVSRLATGLRADRARRATARAHRAQVLITAPVGLCFLPAFLAVGVAPVVIGLAGGLLSGG